MGHTKTKTNEHVFVVILNSIDKQAVHIVDDAIELRGSVLTMYFKDENSITTSLPFTFQEVKVEEVEETIEYLKQGLTKEKQLQLV